MGVRRMAHRAEGRGQRGKRMVPRAWRRVERAWRRVERAWRSAEKENRDG